jgi:hypothetical protein
MREYKSGATSVPRRDREPVVVLAADHHAPQCSFDAVVVEITWDRNRDIVEWPPLFPDFVLASAAHEGGHEPRLDGRHLPQPAAGESPEATLA